MNNPEFSSQRNQGFQIRFKNGYTVSVQFGHNHYCSNRDLSLDVTFDSWRNGDDMTSCPNAEVAVIDPNGDFVSFDSTSDQVRPHTDPDTVAKIIAWASSLKAPNAA